MNQRKFSERTIQKYKLIVNEWFVNGFNGTRAYQRFYPKSKASTADKRFRELTEIDRIQNYIANKKEAAEKLLWSQHEGIVKEIQNWAYSDITQLIGLNSDQIKALPKDIRRLISKYRHVKRNVIDNDGNVSEIVERFDVSFVSKEKAMEMLNKHTGFYEKDNHQKITTEPKVSREERDAYINNLIYKHLNHNFRSLAKEAKVKKYTITEFFEVLGIISKN